MAKVIELPVSSRNSRTKLFQAEDPTDPSKLANSYFWGTWTPIDFPETEGDKTVFITEQDQGRLDLLAYNNYGDVNLWWVIAHVNDLLNPLDIPIGTPIRLPDKGTVLSILSNRELAVGQSLPFNNPTGA